jgi:hypothetical protein
MMQAGECVDGATGEAAASTQLPGPSPSEGLAAWVRRSTAAQGLPEKISDADVILSLQRLLDLFRHGAIHSVRDA